MPVQILIVEDSPTQGAALEAHLSGAGYTTTLARSGDAALQLLVRSRCDVVISDIVMPGSVDGYELCRRIKHSDRRGDTPVVLLTSLSDPMDIIRGLECGADNFFTKPYDPRHLLNRLEVLLATRQARARHRVKAGVTIFFMGREFTISSDREQILDLLITTFEEAVHQNRELRQREEELNAAKAELHRYAQSLEARLQAVLESVPDVLYSVNAQLSERYYTSPACRVTVGYSPDELAANPGLWVRAILVEDQSRVRHFLERAVLTGAPDRIEYQLHHRDGTVRWIEDAVVPIRGPNSTITRLDGVARDVTERKQLEDQLRQAQKMEAVGRLAGGIAHDFNNVLTAIFGYTDLLMGELPPDSGSRRDLTEIRKAAERASALTKQLLAFSRQQVLQPVVLNINELVQDIDKMLTRLLGEDVQLQFTLAPDLSNVRADPGQIQQVLMNLVVNARDAMPQGGNLLIETANADLTEQYAELHQPVVPGRYAMLAVSDTGTGMDSSTKSRIFEPFFTTKEKGRGTGLGLSTAYGIVKQSGGYIWVYSELGRGTTFKVYLPRVDGSPERAEAPRDNTDVRGTETILLAEDDEILRPLARGLLERLGYRVLEAEDTARALALAASHPDRIHLLVSDVIMPGVSGNELAKRLTAIRPDMKVLYVSGYTDDAIVQHGMLERGMNFLQKPFTPGTLARKVREVLDKT